MDEFQFNKLMSMLTVIAQNTAAIAWQANEQRPLTGVELGQCAESVRRTAEMLEAGLDVSVLPPGVLNPPKR